LVRTAILLALVVRDGRYHGTQEEWDTEPHGLKRLPRYARREALEVDDDVEQLGHGARILPGPPRGLNPASVGGGRGRRAGQGGRGRGRWRRDARQGILVDLQVGCLLELVEMPLHLVLDHLVAERGADMLLHLVE